MWLSLSKWHEDYPWLSFTESLALFEARSKRRRRRYVSANDFSHVKTWQPRDINLCRQDLPLERSSTTTIRPTQPVLMPSLFGAGPCERHKSQVVAKICDCDGWQNFPRCLPAALCDTATISYRKALAFCRLARICTYPKAERLLWAAHRKTTGTIGIHNVGLTTDSIDRVTLMVAAGQDFDDIEQMQTQSISVVKHSHMRYTTEYMNKTTIC